MFAARDVKIILKFILACTLCENSFNFNIILFYVRQANFCVILVITGLSDSYEGLSLMFGLDDWEWKIGRSRGYCGGYGRFFWRVYDSNQLLFMALRRSNLRRIAQCPYAVRVIHYDARITEFLIEIQIVMDFIFGEAISLPGWCLYLRSACARFYRCSLCLPGPGARISHAALQPA